MGGDSSSVATQNLCCPFEAQDGDSYSVLTSFQKGDFMFLIDINEVYLQIPRLFLRFVVNRKIHQFKAQCFGITSGLHQGVCLDSEAGTPEGHLSAPLSG